jgi:hypothetical protein
MRRRLLLVGMIVLAASACEYREILRIDADGTAVVGIEIDALRGESSPLPFGPEWTSLEEQATDFAEIEPDRDEIRQFVTDFFALEGTEDMVDLIAESLVLEVDGEQLHIAFDTAEIDVFSFSGEDRGLDLILLGDMKVRQGDDGSISLSLDARARAAEFLSELYAIEGDPFVSGLADNPDLHPLTMTAEIQLPGSIRENDAHDIEGNTLRWSWTVGEDAGPGLSARWDPGSDTDDGSEFAVPNAIVVWALVTIGVFGLGVLAATLGFVEGRRVRRRDSAGG